MKSTRILWSILLLTFLLVGCVLPAKDFQEARPSEAVLFVDEIGPDTYEVVFAVVDSENPAVCIDGADGNPVCTTISVVGEDIASDDPQCTLSEGTTLLCILPGSITSYRLNVSSAVRPVASIGFYLERDRTQPLYLDAR